MAKIAVELDQALALRAESGGRGSLLSRRLAEGIGWSVSDVICTSGPGDQPFQEQHSDVRIALVACGSFQYRGAAGQALMTPGSFLLGSAGQAFECAHDHGNGDRCISFGYAPDYFERISPELGAGIATGAFRALRLPPIRILAPLVARAFSGLVSSAEEDLAWEELSLELAKSVIEVITGTSMRCSDPSSRALELVTRCVRTIESDPFSEITVGSLAREAELSPYHFLRTFEQLTGVTPHQFILRTRLREAALELLVGRSKVIDIALGCGFGDISNFNRAFRSEFGVSPRTYRLQTSKVRLQS